MFVVIGATGNTGSAVVETLLSKKQPVRVIVRSVEKGVGWNAKGAEVAVASLDDVSALSKGLEGANGVYVMVPPNYGAEAWVTERRTRVERAAQAVEQSGVDHIVFLSSVGGHITGATGPIRTASYGEHVFGCSAKRLTILRPGYFMENWAPVIGAAKTEGILPTFLAPEVKIPMISTKDIGRVAAEQLIAGGYGKRIVEMAGPEEYSPNQVAEALGHILGKRVTAQHAPLSAVVPTFTSFGFSDEAAKLFEEMYAAFSNGTIRYEEPGKLVRGTITLSEALRGMV
ncbi:MAG: NmrA family NAD(P)-binding protein [Nitrospira sp.]